MATRSSVAVDGVVRQRRADDRGRVARAPADDPFRRLRGEPPVDSASLEDARLWLEVYTEMMMFWQHTAVQMGLWLEEVASDHAREELRAVDQRLIEDRCERVRRRLRLWELRAHELGGQVDEEACPDGAGRGVAPACR